MAQHLDTQVRERRRLSGGVITSLIAVAALIIFLVQNTSTITVRFLILSFSWPLWLYTIVMAAVGALLWFGLSLMRRHRRLERRAERW